MNIKYINRNSVSTNKMTFSSLVTEHQQKHGTFSRCKLEVRRTSFKPVPFSDTSLITSSHILYSMSTGFSDGKGRVNKWIFWSSENNNYTCSFSRSSYIATQFSLCHDFFLKILLLGRPVVFIDNWSCGWRRWVILSFPPSWYKIIPVQLS